MTEETLDSTLKAAALIADEARRAPDKPGVYRMYGEDGSCLYECSALSEYYFPGQDMARCFMFDEATGSWPAELLDLKRERLDVYTFPNTVIDGGIAFTVVRPQVPGVACLLLW